MQRKEFLLTSCKAALMFAAGTVLFNQCRTIEIHETADEISVPVSAMKKKNNLLITAKKLDKQILVVRQKDGGYHALQMSCTHKGADLVFKNNELVCPAHGSIFDLDGNVLKSPASRELKKYSVSDRAGEIVINLRS